MKTILLFLFLFLPQDQLKVIQTESTAQSSTTTTVTESLLIGQHKTDEVVSIKTSPVASKPVVILAINTQAPKLRLKSKTCKPVQVGSNEYAVTEAGTHTIDILGLGVIDGELFFEELEVIVKVGGVIPDPVDPDDPYPPPTPPIDPDPPIKDPGLRVLMVYESQDLPIMSADQKLIFFSTRLRDYLNDNCVLSDVTKTREWRIFDQDIEFPINCDSVWCNVMERPRASIPWIVISNGMTGFEGPLPRNVEDTITLINQYK